VTLLELELLELVDLVQQPSGCGVEPVVRDAHDAIVGGPVIDALSLDQRARIRRRVNQPTEPLHGSRNPTARRRWDRFDLAPSRVRPMQGGPNVAKRELIDTGTDKRYVRRAERGRFKESDDVGRSLSADRRQTAKTPAKKGQGDKGDRKS